MRYTGTFALALCISPLLLDELKRAGAERWEKVKAGVEHALDDLSQALD